MELRQLKYFLAVADARSFVSAANNLYISRQAVSKAISQLESELNVELFMRDTNGAFLTPAGIIFYERVRSNVLELDQLQNEMQLYGSQFHQVIRIAFSVGTLHLYEHHLQEFLLEQKNVVVNYHEYAPDICEDLLREKKVDIAICSKPIDNPLFHSTPLCRSRYGVLLKDQSDLDSLKEVDLLDLLWLPLACFADGQTEQFCKDNSLSVQYTGIDLYRLIDMAREGRCATILPECLLPKYIQGIRWIPLNPPQYWQVSEIYLQSHENNALYHSVLDELMMHVFNRQVLDRGNS